jgi:gamma-glutamyl hercynylcysteine S-oxide synthase
MDRAEVKEMSTAERVAADTLPQMFRRARGRTDRYFGLVREEAFFSRPLALRHPIVFYRGHLAAFAVNTLLKRALGRPGIREDFEILFERGIDPADKAAAVQASISAWPPRSEIEAYVAEADVLLGKAFAEIDAGHAALPAPALEAALMCLEHETMHQETLLYILHRLSRSDKVVPDGMPSPLVGAAPPPEIVRVPGGRVTLGADRGEIPFGWDNEYPRASADVAAFEIDRYDVTNGEYLEFVEAGGYANERYWSPDDWAWIRRDGIEHPLYWEGEGKRWRWRAMFEDLDLPLSWPVYASHAEAAAFARWRGRRLPTEPEYHRAAHGTSSGRERPFPWGEEAPDFTRANFDLYRHDPVPVGSFPGGESFWGVADLLGNGWEWTSTPFSGFPGFRASPLYPAYSADFFDGKHFVMKGGSPATSPEFLRRSFRNWFQAHYPYPYATFRCAKDAA